MFASVAIGLLIGFVNYLFEDVIGFSLIIIFPLIYGWIIGFILAKLFFQFKLQNQRLAIIFAVLSITIAIGLFIFLDRAYIERLLLAALASEGYDVTDRYLTWYGYFFAIGELGTQVSFFGVGQGISLTGMWFYGLMIFEFALMYYYAIKNVREQHSKLSTFKI